jgi:NAD(P) transhydrogenase subunit beta
LAAKKVKMTAMPQMVSIFNGMGGACAALISLVEYNHLVHNSETAVNLGTLSIILLGLIIGSVSFAGSMIAWGKLNGNIKKDFAFLGNNSLILGFYWQF